MDKDKSVKWKSAAAVILIVFACIVGTLSVAIVWLNKVVLDTDTYVETVTPLSKDPAIKDAIANRITAELFARTSAEDLAREVLPEQVNFLAAPIVGATEGYVNEEIRKQLDSDEFVTIWKESNRKAHEIVKQVLLGDKGVVYSEQGKINIDLGKLFESVKTRLSARGINIFDNISLEGPGVQYTIFEYQNITKAQDGLNLLNRLATWLPIVALALWAVAIWLSRNRWNSVFWIGIGLAAGMVVLLVGIAIVRDYYLNAVESSNNIDLPAATSFFDIIMASLKTTVRRAFAFGLVVAAAGFVMGPYPAAVKLRAYVVRLYRAGKTAGEGLAMGPSGAWIVREKGLLRAAGIIAALLLLVVISPTIWTTLIIAALLIVYIASLEYLGRKAG